MKKERSASVLLYVIDHMIKLREKWHQVYDLPPDHSKWNKEQKKLADHVGVRLQQMAYLVEIGLLDEKYLLENYAAVFFKSWQKLESYVKDYRKKTREPFQRMHLERFAQKCRSYLNRRAKT